MPRCSLAIPPFGFADHLTPRAKVPAWLLGEAMPPERATRTVCVGPCTHHVDVRHGETVRFIVDRGEFSHRFNGEQGDTSLDLFEVAPAGLLAHAVRVYVGPVPRRGGA
jgi:hypothetical protein